MVTSLDQLNPGNITQTCFPIPISARAKERLATDFLPHRDGAEEIKTCAWHKQIYAPASVQDWALRKVHELKHYARTHEATRPLLQETAAAYSDPKRVIEEKTPQIIDHLDRRVALFFQQLVLCHRTPFTYEEGSTEDQFGKGHSLIPASPIKTQAAHSATIPCLYATAADETGERKFVFLKGSHFYIQSNSTMELPDVVNKVDSLLDFQSATKIRQISLDIINQTARGTFTPVQGTRIFLTELKSALEQLIEKYQHDEAKELVKDVCLIYLDRVNEILNFEDAMVDQLMGVRFDGADAEENLRKIVYESRYKLLQTAQLIESQIVKRILQAQTEIFGRPRSVKSTRSVDWKLRYILLQDKNNWQRRSLEKLFCTSLEQLQATKERTADLRQRELLKVNQEIEQIKIQHKEQIENLQRDLRYFLQEMLREELIFRSQLFKKIREEYKHWTPEQVVTAFKTLFPNDPMSKTMVWRLEHNLERDPSEPEVVAVRPIERSTASFKEALKTDPSQPRTSGYKTPRCQRRKVLDSKLAQKISQALGIDAGLFLPSMLCSV